MSRSSFAALVATFCLVTAPAMSVEAQANGAINGRVTDAATGRGIADALVRIEGTGQGVATDTAGRFRLREVRPGHWTLTVQRIGYRALRRDSVLIAPGEVLRLELSLASVAVEVEGLTVREERDPILDPLAPGAVQRVTEKDFRNLPITTLDDALELSAGTVDQSVRGGRPGQQSFVLDGVGIKNQLDASSNSGGAYFPPDMLQEASLISNSFSARYGSAISGLINVTTRDGTDQWTGRVAYETDRPFPDGWDYGLDRAVVAASGPLFAGIKMVGVLDFNGRIDAEPVGAPQPKDTLDLRHDSPMLPFNSGEIYSGALKLGIPIAGHDVRLFALRSAEQRQLFDAAYKYDGRWSPVRRVTATVLTAQVQHTFGRTTVNPLILDARFGWFDREFLRGATETPLDQKFGAFTFEPLHIIGEDIARRQQPALDSAPIPGMLVPQYSENSPYGVPAYFNGTGGRGEVTWNRYHEGRIQLDFTKGLGQGADLLFGTDVALQHVQTYQRVLGYLPVGFGDSVPPATASTFDPTAIGVYTEAQQRWGELALTAGVRYDRFDPGQGLDSTVKARDAVSPRLALSTVFNGATLVISWGRFSQAPDYQYLVDAAFDDTLRTGRFRAGNADLGFETATQYEFSLRTRPSPVTNLRVNVYVKQLTGMIASVPFGADADSSVFANNDYGSVYGGEILFEREVFRGFRARINYTLQFAQGSASDAFRQRTPVVDPVTGELIPASNDQFPLDYDRRHSLIGVLEYRVPDQLPAVLRGLDMSVIGRYFSGLPYSRTTAAGDTILGPPNSQRLPAQYSLDALFRRSFAFGGQRGAVYLDLRNILDQQNVVAVRRDTGSPFMTADGIEDAALARYTEHPEPIPYESPRYRPEADLDQNGMVDGYDELYPQYLRATKDAYQPTFAYSAPRLVRFGLEFSF